jgi:hypothetical protein
LQVDDEDLKESEDESEEVVEEKVGKGRSMVEDWNKMKKVEETLERKDGRDPKNIKRYRSSSSSSSSSS